MYIVDYSTDYRERDVTTTVFYNNDSKATQRIIEFVANQSEDKNFKIKRINKYQRGTLYPCQLTLSHGRMAVEEVPDLPLTPAPAEWPL